MVLACAVMVAMGFGAIVNIAVFLTPLSVEFGWSRGELSAAYSMATIGTGIGGILMGHFADRVPIRRVALCGAVVPGVALVMLSRMTTTTELYVYHVLMGVLGMGAIMAPLNSLAGLWFARNPGLAIGIVSAGGAFGQGIVPFLSRNVVLIHGWRNAYEIMGVAYLVIMLPLALYLRNAPKPASGPAQQASAQDNPYLWQRTTLLAWLSVAVILCCVCMATPIIHVAALAADRGFGPRESAGLLAVMMAAGMAGRIAFGGVADRLGNLRAYILASFGQTALAFLFPLMTSRLELYVLSALFGVVFSGAMTAFILCAREYSPAGRTGLAIGVVMFFAWLGMALGGWQGGALYDLCGSYVPPFINASVSGILNLGVLAVLYRATIGFRRSISPA